MTIAKKMQVCSTFQTMPKKKCHINYRPYPTQNPTLPPAYFRCKNHAQKCSEVFSNLKEKNEHETSCLVKKPHQCT